MGQLEPMMMQKIIKIKCWLTSRKSQCPKQEISNALQAPWPSSNLKRTTNLKALVKDSKTSLTSMWIHWIKDIIELSNRMLAVQNLTQSLTKAHQVGMKIYCTLLVARIRVISIRAALSTHLDRHRGSIWTKSRISMIRTNPLIPKMCQLWLLDSKATLRTNSFPLL